MISRRAWPTRLGLPDSPRTPLPVRRAARLTSVRSRGILNLFVLEQDGYERDGPDQPRVRGARGPHPAGDPDPADRGRRDRRGARGAVQHVPAGDLPAPEGAGAGGPGGAGPARPPPAQSPGGRAPPRGDPLAGRPPTVRGREP